MKKKGFTLIELMIVIAILAVLAGIAIPSYMGYVRKAKAKELLSFARLCIEEAVSACMSDSNVNINTLESCNPNYKRKLPCGEDVKSFIPPESCNLSGTMLTIASTEIKGKSFTATCTYEGRDKKITCTLEQK